MEKNNFLVGIDCITYNHRNYIVDAMNGFTMQQTNFPFVAVIVDDASTDGELEVISNYLEEHFDLSPESEARQWENEEARYVYARHKENKNCYFAVVFLKTNYHSKGKSKDIHTDQWLSEVKYIATCEGDDYWTHHLKLQMQVDFLMKNTRIGLVYTDFDKLYQTIGKQELQVIGSGSYPIITSFKQHLELRGFIAPMSWMYRANYKSIALEDKNRPQSIEGSFIFALEMFLKSEISYINVVTCVRRILDESASHSQNPFKLFDYNRDVKNLQVYYSKKYLKSGEIKKDLTDWFYKRYFIFIIKNSVYSEYSGLIAYYSHIRPNRIKQWLFSLLIHNSIGRKILFIKFSQ